MNHIITEEPSVLFELIYRLIARLALERVYNSLLKQYGKDDRFKITKPLFLTQSDAENISLHFAIIYGS
jgi:hypothetical protein